MVIMVICSACDHESSSKRDRSKGSTCKDCVVDNQIVEHEYTIDPCDCHAVDHDKSKLRKTPDIEESLFDSIKASIVKEKKQSENISYKIKQLEKLKNETESIGEIEHYEQQIKKLQRDKDIGG